MTATTAVDIGSYVFGIVPDGTPVPSADEAGPAADLHLVPAGDIAALVGRVVLDRPLGRAADLRAHDRVLADVVRAGSTVLPMRFGAVLTDDAAVVAELLVPHRERFSDAMATLRGRVQYSLKVQYREEEVLAEVVAADPEIRRLRAVCAERDDPAAKLRMGQLVVRQLERMRGDDASAVLTGLLGTVDVRVRETGPPDDVLDAAFLVDAAGGPEFVTRAEQVAARFARRMRFTLTGPSAAYDFVGDD